MATLGERIIESLGGITAARMQEATEAASVRAYEAGYSDANDEPPSGDLKSFGYRKMSSGGKLRDFSKISRDKEMEVVWTLYQSSPLARRILSLKRDHIIGKNARPSTKDEKLKAILDAFWDDNELEARAREFTLQLFLLGEQIYPAFVREKDGRTRIGYIDTADVSGVVCHPDNSMQMSIIMVGGSYENPTKAYRIIRHDDDYVDGGRVVQAKHPGKLVTAEQANVEPWEMAMLKEKGLREYAGSVFFFKVNSVSNMPRGHSDLLQAADWIDQYEQTLFALGEREQFAAYFSWFVKLTGVQEGSDAWNRARNRIGRNPPKRGSVNMTNENEDWDLKTADLKQSGSIAAAEALLGHTMGGSGYPMSWYAFGNDTNRSTLSEQATPSEKSLEHDQGIVEEMLLMLCQFVADQAEIAGEWKPEEKDKYPTIAVELPSLRAEDMKGVTATFAPTIAALDKAIQMGILGRRKAAEVFHKLLKELNIEIDTAAELDDIDGENEQAELDDAQKNNDKLNGMLQKANGQAAPENMATMQGLNGAQIAAVLNVLERMASGQISPLVAKELIVSVGLTEEKADRIVSSPVKVVAPPTKQGTAVPVATVNGQQALVTNRQK